MFELEHLNKMREGIELYNQQMYWECHESFEDLWMEDRNDPVRNVYWAIIQVAAACIHYRDSNLIGARGMITKAKEKFKRCREQKIVSELLLKKLDWLELEDLVEEINGQTTELGDFVSLYDFRFKHYP